MHIRWAAYGFAAALLLLLSLSSRGVSTESDNRAVEVQMQNVFYLHSDSVHVVFATRRGYTKETPSFGLRVSMRDYNKLSKGKAAVSAGKRN